jgi:nucleoside-diphosphate-sugar epimerase
MSKQEQQTVLVTGARGFIGRALVTQLQHCGKQVLVLDQDADPNSEAPNSYTCDIMRVDQLRHVFESRPIDGIVHLAAILPTAATKDPFRAAQVNVIGSLYLLELARQFGVRRFVFGSSLSIYGTWPADEIVSESYKPTPLDPYGTHKLCAERIGEAYAEVRGLEFASLRIGRVVGPGAKSMTSSWRSEIFELLGETRVREIRIPYVESERILLVHVGDVAKSLAKLLDAPKMEHAIYNGPCESVVVGDLKKQVESLNPRITVVLGDGEAAGNPRKVDWSRFRNEFGFESVPIFDQLRLAAQEGNLSG